MKARVTVSLVIMTLSLGLIFVYSTAIQRTQILTPVDAAITNATQGAKSAANQTGEAVKSLANKTGETLQRINPFK